MARSLSIEVLDATRRLPEPALKWLIQHIEKAARHLGTSGEVRIRIVDDAEMAGAHEEFAGVEGTTDVLTFDMTDPEGGPPPKLDQVSGRLADNAMFGIDTDILVCLDEADRQFGGSHEPKPTGSGVEKELLLYAVHGVLHCLGMDDHDEAEAAAMHRVEDAVLTAIGVGPVYAKRGPSGASG